MSDTFSITQSAKGKQSSIAPAGKVFAAFQRSGGRAITRQEDFYKTGTLTCEGVLAYLYDTYYPPFEFSGSPTDFLSAVLDNHNAQVEERKQLQLGNVTVEDNNDYISRSSIEYNRTLTVLTDKLINDSLGGYFRVRIVDGVKYLDYLSSYGTTATQPVEFGVNLLDIAQNVEYSDLATVILPLGAKLEDSDGNQTDEYLTISSVNGGSIYYADEDAVEEYGWIVVCNIWEDVTEASNLLTKAKSYLAQVTSAVSSFEVSAVDLALVSAEYDYINLGDYVLIQSDPHGINQYVELTAMDIDLLDPANDTLTFGADSASLTDSQRSSDRNVQTALESLSARYTNLVATAITADYLTANYLTANDIAALYVKADDLEATVATFGYLTADNAKLTYATIENLDAATANITDLTAEVANINSVLAGNIGAGTIQTMHLTSDNVVIDDAIITDAMIADLSASKLTAGTIYTDKVTIQSESGNLYITDNTIQIQDGTTVRVQIGEDASGDYNLYLWDASGALIWDAQGLTEAGLTGNGAIIKDAAVADDANISGYKLDISSVASCLNEDGSLVVDAAQVTIDDTTLDYKLTTITDNTDAAQAAAEAAQAAAVAAQSTADDAASAAATAASDAATAQSAADAAKSAADTAQSAADTAQADATAAQATADAAQATADQAATDLTQAQADLQTALDNYTTLAAQANATDEELAAA
ncbi:MAG: phage tail protein [Clostridiales bacterium]|nr:phage tail protein [Clostridiales bacterium]